MEALNQLNDLLQSWGVPPTLADVLDNLLALVIVLIIAFVADAICRNVIVKMVARVTQRTKATWDDIIFHPKVMRQLCRVVAPVIVFQFLPAILDGTGDFVLQLITRLTSIYILYVVLRFVNAFLLAVYEVYSDLTTYRDRPLKGLLQTGQIIVWGVGLIAMVSLLIDKSLLTLLAGLGASAAVLMLIFKDSIVGLASGVQLSVNDMLRVGDWIEMSKNNIDGEVIEVSLITVKVRNWDKTIVTIPPYSLITDSFNNWRGMKDSGGRRVKRYLNIDMSSVKFATHEMLERYQRIMNIETQSPDNGAQGPTNEGQNIADKLGSPDNTTMDCGHPTNLGALRVCLLAYLKNHPCVHKELSCMVRQLQPTQHGIPLELYFFTNTTVWADYEAIQADIFDYILAILPQFDLRVYQLPSGRDLHDQA